MPKNIKLILILLLASFCLFLAISPVFAVKLANPLTGKATPTTPAELYGRIINAFLGVVGTLALVMFIWGGVQWMFSGGNPEKIKKGRDTLLWAVLGMAVIFSSYIILQFVLKALTGVK